jgi:hypothetical protein
MKKDTRHNLGWAARMRLAVRILGLTGVFAAVAGLALFAALGNELVSGRLRDAMVEGAGVAAVGAFLFVVGSLVAIMWLVIELLSWLGGSGQRSMVGANSGLQVLLAAAVFAGLNYYSFSYFVRCDLTRKQEFTLPTPVVNEMRELKGQTTVVVLQRHKSLGQLSGDQREVDDYAYDSAAERKVVDKVRDLVDQLRFVGPQFRVVALNHGAKGYDKQVDEETARRPGLKEAIASAPENSIFFYPDDRVEELTPEEIIRRTASGHRIFTTPIKDSDKVVAYEGNIPRLSFNEFYQLDKTASKAANPGPDGKPLGNLVLRPQGVEAFARRVLSIQEKKPRVGLLVIHEVLSSDPGSSTRETFTSAGLRRSLEDRGFEVVDIVIKKWGEGAGPTPAAYTLAETQFERLEAELEGMDEERRDLQEERKNREAGQTIFREKSLSELTKLFRDQIRRDVTEEDRQLNLRALADRIKQIDERLVEMEQERRGTETQMSALLLNERAFEDRRVTDLEAKMTKLAGECDFLIVPRLTVLNASALEVIDPNFYTWSAIQAKVLKEFMKTGKPVMVCAGPNVEVNQVASREPLDDVERLLIDRGVQLGRETIITSAEAKGFAARRAGGALGGAPTDIPPVTFPEAKDGKDNPIAAAMRATAASADQQLDFRLQNPRPVYLVPDLAKKLQFSPDFLLSPAAAWNEEKPMAARNLGGGRALVVPPRFKATPYDDPKKGTLDEVRRGPFPIGVAIESPMPVEWYENDYSGFSGLKGASALSASNDVGLLSACLTVSAAIEKDKETNAPTLQAKRKTGRLVVIGHGGLFTGKTLSPAHEQLLLHSTNWLLKRDDRLPRTDGEWKYPRVQRDERQSFLWKWGPFLGLPLVFLYLGLIVWIVRRVR